MEPDAIKSLRNTYPRHNVHQSEVYGIPVYLFYTIYPGDDPSAPHPYVEDHMVFTSEGIPAEWVPDSEVRHMEDVIFAAHKARGRGCGALG